MTEANAVLVERDGPVTIVSINRPHCRNAVDGATARKLYDAFLAFDADEAASVAVFTGTGGYFCAGADLKAVAAGDPNKKREIGGHNSIAPMGPSRLRLTKPVIAAVEGFAVAGGMELALWADMRVVAEDATFGIFCRRFGVPLIDLGTIRLPRLIGVARMMDMMLTGRVYSATEGTSYGFAQYVTEAGNGLGKAMELATKVASNAPLTNFAVLQALPMIAEANPQTGLLMESLMATVAQSDKEAKRRIREFLEHKTAKVKPKS
jgi:enoyl-CoA hydratase